MKCVENSIDTKKIYNQNIFELVVFVVVMPSFDNTVLDNGQKKGCLPFSPEGPALMLLSCVVKNEKVNNNKTENII